jgi:hypothetical protein
VSAKSSRYPVPTPHLQTRPATNGFKVSFEFLVSGTNYEWPSNPADAYLISSWLSGLSKKQNLKELLTLRVEFLPDRVHHEISEDKFSWSARQILLKLRSSESFAELTDYPIYSLRYCYRDHSPERLLVVTRGAVLYVLWWDKEHRSYSKPIEGISNDICDRIDCLHPYDFRFSS